MPEGQKRISVFRANTSVKCCNVYAEIVIDGGDPSRIYFDTVEKAEAFAEYLASKDATMSVVKMPRERYQRASMNPRKTKGG